MASPSQKSSSIGIRFSSDEKRRLEERAREEKKTLSELIRSAVLEHTRKDSDRLALELQRKVYFALGKITEYLQTLDADASEVNEIQELVNATRRKLLGLESW
ncbi:ribbon-helix-helix protein, CopG family [Pannus brasiliensis CCIBt3594]|uniref:Ribbon-helix-helix protein, CopG family n=1 Tax=Pannus brasiliensis CCIBt3594 TaxID=1427578 RepID=A0AAW9QV93_9CHRO